MKKIIILTLSLLTINLVSKAQVEIVSSGTSGAYAVTVPGTFILSNGLQVTFKAHTANTAGATLSVSGTATKNITKLGGSVNIAGSDILTNQIVTVAYDGTTWQMISAIGSTPSASNDWTTTGNSGTNSGVNYIGTSDAADLSFRTNGVIKARLTQKGQLEFMNTGNSVFIGAGAGASDDLSSNENIFVGDFAGYNTTTSNWNTALGSGALYENITGTSNTAIGRVALSYNTGSWNTATGTYALFWGTSGSGNTGIGGYAGQTITTGSNNTFLGYSADATDATLTNATAIGYNAKVGQSNSLILGGTGADVVNVGIGTSSPSAKLDVSSTSYSLLQLSTTGANSNVNIDINTTGAGTAQFSQYGGTGGFTFATQGTLPTPAMSIIDNGNVGIGTTAPAQKLEIQDGHILLSNTGTQSELRFKEASANGGNIISFKAPASLAANVNYTLPINVGAANDVLSNDGTGTLSWTTPAALVNIYNSNGALTGARTVTQGANTLAFTASAVNAFSVDGTTFSIDALNNYVGIGTAPALPFDVANSTQTTTSRFANTLNSNSQKMAVYGWTTGALAGTNIGGAFESMNSTGENYGVYGNASGNSGNKKGVYASASGTGTNNGGYFSSSGGTNDYGVYSIATAAGTSNAYGIFSSTAGNGSGTTYGVYGQNSSSSTGATYAGNFENFNSTGSIIYGVRSSLTGNAGGTVTKYGIRSDVIGTASSNVGGYFRAVGGTTNHAIQLVDGSEANNRVLASDAAGMATWTDLSTLTSGGATAWTRVNPNIYPTTLTDKVGIGVTIPVNKLDVEGAAVIGTTFSGTNTAPTNGLLVEGTVGIGTPSPGTYGLYSAVGTSTNKKTLTVSAFGASFVDNAPAVLEIRGGTNTVGAEVGVIDFINTSNGSIDYNFARISAHRENANATFASLRFYTRTGSTLNEAMRINENGKIGIGITDPIEILEIGSTDSDIELETYSATESSSLHIKRGRGTLAIPTIPSSGDYYGGVGFQAWDGTAFQEGARIQGTVDGIVGATDMPGRLEFWTSPDGSATAVERMRITNGGNVGIGTTTPGTSRLFAMVPSTDVTNNIGLTVTNNYTGASAKYGIDVNVDGAGSGIKYGISSSVVGLAGDASTIYGYQVTMTPNGTGTSYGIYSSQATIGTGIRYGFYNSVSSGATNTSAIYGVRTIMSNLGTGTAYGMYVSGEDINYFSGTVGIGTTTPDLTMGLDLQIATGAYVANFENTTGATGDDGIKINLGNALPSTSAFYLGCYAAGGLDGGLRGDGAGGVGLYTASDRRLKENIIDLPDALSTLSKISAKQYEFKKAPGKKMYGFIAQDLLEIYPTAVAEPDGQDGIFMVNYASLTPLLTGGINELHKLVKEQQTQIEELRREIDALKNK